MKYQGWFSTREHLKKIQEIRDKTPLYKRLIQRYDMPSNFPYVSQMISQLLSPCISVVSIEVESEKIKIKSLKNQSKGMPMATPVNFRTDIDRTLEKRDLIRLEKVEWQSPILGWSKREWILVDTNRDGEYLLAVSEIPKQKDRSKTEALMKSIAEL